MSAQTVSFSNNTPNAHNTWDSGNNWNTALTKTIDVSGLPTSALVLRQINVDLGSASGSNISTLAARLTDPQGNTINVFNAGYFYDTDFSRFVNIKLRDHSQLNRLNDYTLSYLGMPYSFGYYRVEVPGSYASLNTTDAVNGAWTFAMIENTGTEIQFNGVELVFGPPFTVTDITSSSSNNSCAGAQCVQSGNNEILLATNVGYPQNQPNFPALTLNGCNWNAEPNNTAWFYFVASSSNVALSVSGFNNSIQQTLVLRNDGTCAAPAYAQVGCPLSMYVNACNTTTGDPALYHRVCYDGGTKFNHGYSLTGLTVGQEYVFVVDGQSAANTTFYLEIANGADNGCALVADDPEITDVLITNTGCSNDAGSITILATGIDLEYSIDGGQTFQTSNAFSGLSAGTYAIVVMDGNGATAVDEVILLAPELPVIDGVDVVQPTCGLSDGAIAISATGMDLEYSIDGGASFQSSGQFNDLPAATYPVVVINADGCQVLTEVSLVAPNGPLITDVQVIAPTCNGDTDGAVSILATGADPLTYSLDGGSTFQLQNVFPDLAAGNFTVVVQDANGCSVSQTIEVLDPAPVVLSDVDVSPESCAGACDGSISAAEIPGALFSINGSNTQSSGLFNDLCPGTYVLLVANANGCSASQEVVVEQGATVTALFTADPVEVPSSGTAITFTNASLGADSYIWDFGVHGTSFAEEPLFNFPEGEESLLICLTAISAQACEDSYCVVFTLLEAGELELPNIFTPNGDGVNDTFGVFGNTAGVTEFSLEVFNRWGQLLFAGDRVGMVWDGRQPTGEPVSEGTYFYVLTYAQAGATEARTGHVTLVR